MKDEKINSQIKEIVFIRHGESIGNALKGDKAVYTGGWDCDLTEKGYQQAGELTGNPLLEGADVIFVSDLKRAIDTAKIIFPGKEYMIDPRIRERSLGDFEGKRISDVMREPEYQKYFHDPEYANFRSSFSACAPGGESYSDVCKRVRTFIEEIKHSYWKKVIIVSHFVSIRCMIKELNGLTEEETLSFKVPNCEPILVQKGWEK